MLGIDYVDLVRGLPLRSAYVLQQRRRGVILKDLAAELEMSPANVRSIEMKAITAVLKRNYADPDRDLISVEDHDLIQHLGFKIELINYDDPMDDDPLFDEVIRLSELLRLRPRHARMVAGFARQCGGDWQKAVRFAVCWSRASELKRLPLPAAKLAQERIDELRGVARYKMAKCRDQIMDNIREYLALARTATDDRQAEHPRNTQPPSKDDLDTILWRGRQWAVTTFGIEKLDGGYYLAAAGLETDHHILEHVALKPWCDVEDFANAYIRARILFASSEKSFFCFNYPIFGVDVDKVPAE